MSCQHSKTMGKYAGYNAVRELLGLPLKRYRQPNYTSCLDLGNFGAVFTTGWERQVQYFGADLSARGRQDRDLRGSENRSRNRALSYLTHYTFIAE